jgi:hypothetical protein
MEVGALWINNDRTHLEGVWNIKTGSIETGELTTDAPKYTATEKTERKG